MIQARPLYDTGADARYFVPPNGWQRLRNAVAHDFNVAVVAPRGGGKTTALRQLQRLLREQGTRVAYVDAARAADVGELVWLIEAELAGRAGALREMRDDLASAAGAVAGGPPGSTSVRLVQRLRGLRDQPKAVILLDCAYAAQAANALFGRLRDELWQLEHRWVAAVNDSERSVLLAPPADAFFDQVVVLDAEPGILEEILERRGEELDAVARRRIAQVAGTPRQALQAARDALTGEGDPLTAALWRQEEAAGLGRPHSMAMAELEALGGASASDAEFLRRLGWTRARAVQVLGELADRGLVEVSDEHGGGSGRPRRIYRPAEPRGAGAPSNAAEIGGSGT